MVKYGHFPPRDVTMTSQAFYPIGTPGQPWGEAERAAWLGKQVKHRSYADDVLTVIDQLRDDFDVAEYGALDYGTEHFPLIAVRSRHWRDELPVVLVTGGVHGYETSGVHGALQFLLQHGQDYAGRANVLAVPCVSPWAYERIHRWNPNAIDPNRNFRKDSPSGEAAALVNMLEPLRDSVLMHIDLHETTDSDESEFRPAVAARDGKDFEPGEIPDGFYLVDDDGQPQPAFQQAVIEAVAKVTHIAEADSRGEIIGSPLLIPGVIKFPVKQWSLCAAITNARYATTTEVYPDSPRATPQQCNDAQVSAIRSAIDYALAHGG